MGDFSFEQVVISKLEMKLGFKVSRTSFELLKSFKLCKVMSGDGIVPFARDFSES